MIEIIIINKRLKIAPTAHNRLTAATPPTALQADPAQPVTGQLPVETYSYDPVHNRQSSQYQPGLWH